MNDNLLVSAIVTIFSALTLTLACQYILVVILIGNYEIRTKKDLLIKLIPFQWVYVIAKLLITNLKELK